MAKCVFLLPQRNTNMETSLNLEAQQALLAQLLSMVSEHKQALFQKIIAQRTRHLCIVLEDIYQSQNASAVLRSADCFGVQDVHIIEKRNEYTINPDVALGSSKWLSLYKYNTHENNTLAAYKHLRAQGYTIVATTPHTNDIELQDWDMSKKTALVFGTELQGLSQEAIDQADAHIKIPMYGFTESFNISVSAALSMFALTQKMRQSNIPWQLNEQDKTDILLGWAKATVKSSEDICKRFIEVH